LVPKTEAMESRLSPTEACQRHVVTLKSMHITDADAPESAALKHTSYMHACMCVCVCVCVCVCDVSEVRA
jgi:hypothetical protein